MTNRHEDNIKILRLLRILIDKYPDQRFGQLLSNYVIPSDCKDTFYPEGNYFIKKIDESLRS